MDPCTLVWYERKDTTTEKEEFDNPSSARYAAEQRKLGDCVIFVKSTASIVMMRIDRRWHTIN